MPEVPVHTIDLKFLNSAHAIAAYLVPHAEGVLLVESGPASTLPALEAGVQALGYAMADITDLLVTHIHLDHAGAAGWLARNGTRVHVHPNGAPHLLDPTKLLSSARRIYGDLMDTLWGEVLAVPDNCLHVVDDGDVLTIGGVVLQAVDTPGHANHHHVFLLDGLCFSGDVGGVRLPEARHLQLPCPPPEIHLGKWRASLERLKHLPIRAIAPTHFGIYEDVAWHLQAIERRLDQTEAWLAQVMQEPPPLEALRKAYVAWAHQLALADGTDEAWLEVVEKANPNWMSADGLARYWRKYCQERPES